MLLDHCQTFIELQTQKSYFKLTFFLFGESQQSLNVYCVQSCKSCFNRQVSWKVVFNQLFWRSANFWNHEVHLILSWGCYSNKLKLPEKILNFFITKANQDLFYGISLRKKKRLRTPVLQDYEDKVINLWKWDFFCCQSRLSVGQSIKFNC
jgi:hypothetical protein